MDIAFNIVNAEFGLIAAGLASMKVYYEAADQLGVADDSADAAGTMASDILALASHTVITDFEIGTDQLDLSQLDYLGTPGLSTNDVRISDTVGDGTGDAVLNLPDGSTITLQSVSVYELDPEALESMGFSASDDTTGFQNQFLIDAGIIGGGGGADAIFGSASSETISGGSGNDTIILGGGADTVDGGADQDAILVADGFDGSSIDGGSDGADVDMLDFSELSGGITVNATAGDDGTLADSAGSTAIFLDIEDFAGTDFGDEILTGSGANTVDAGDGNDSIDGGDGDDVLTGGTGNDSAAGGDGSDLIFGGLGDDRLSTGLGEDTLFGGAGDDVLSNSAGNDTLVGGTGNDSLVATLGNDVLYGGTGNDELYGGADDDLLVGGDGDDQIEGGDGNDTLIGDGSNVGRVALRWSDATDDDDGGPVGNGDEIENGSQVVGGVTVNFSIPEDVATFGTETILTDGINAGGSTLNSNSVLSLDNNESGQVDIDFSQSVENVQFRINDFANNETIVIRAFDASNNPITVTVSEGSNISGSDTDAVLGNDTFQGTSGSASDTDVTSSILVTIPGPVSRFEVDFASTGGSLSMTDVFFDDPSSGVGNDTLDGGLGNDLIYAGVGADSIIADGGEDVVYAGDGADTIDGGDQGDTIYGGLGNDVIEAGEEQSIGDDDLIYAGAGADTITSAETDSRSQDTIYAGAGDDRITMSGGENTLFGEAGNDSITGGALADTIYGGTGTDTINAGAGRNILYGGSGDDVLEASAGNDTFTGGVGNDTLVLGAGGGDDTFIDFGTGNDQLDTSALDDSGNLLTNQDGTVTADEVTVTGGGGSDQVLTFPSGETLTVPDGTVDTSSQSAQFASLVAMGVPPCFAPGTLILTEDGEKPVEELWPGDRIVTFDHGLQTLRWIGRRVVDFKDPDAHRKQDKPIQIKAGSLGTGLPKRDLVVSPQHRMMLAGPAVRAKFGQDEVLGLAKSLTSWPGIRVMKGRQSVIYYALLFDRHEIIFAEGAPTESFRPGPTAIESLPKEARDQIHELYPNLRTSPIDGLGAPARTIAKGREIKELAAKAQSPVLRTEEFV